MGKNRRVTNSKRILSRLEHSSASIAEELAYNRGIALAFAAAAFTLFEVYGFENAAVREFIDDMDMRMDEVGADPDGVKALLDMFGIRVRTSAGMPGDTRVRIDDGPDLCQTCAECDIDPDDRIYYCRVKDVCIRRGRSKCKQYNNSRSVNQWQRKLMEAGRPPQENRI